MPRPCECDRPGCPLCRLAATHGGYQRLWGLPVTAPDPSAGRGGPCRHRGDDLSNAERSRLSLDHSKLWVWCEGPAEKGAPAGQPVCSCNGCGPQCPGYSPPEVDSP